MPDPDIVSGFTTTKQIVVNNALLAFSEALLAGFAAVIALGHGSLSLIALKWHSVASREVPQVAPDIGPFRREDIDYAGLGRCFPPLDDRQIEDHQPAESSASQECYIS